PTPPTLSAPARSPYGFTVDAPTEVRAPTDLGTTQGKGRPTIPQALPRNTRPADGGGRGQPRAKRGWSTAVAGLGVQVCLSRLYSRISLLSSVVARMMSPRAARRSRRLLVVGSWAVSPSPTLISLTTWPALVWTRTRRWPRSLQAMSRISSLPETVVSVWKLLSIALPPPPVRAPTWTRLEPTVTATRTPFLAIRSEVTFSPWSAGAATRSGPPPVIGWERITSPFCRSNVHRLPSRCQDGSVRSAPGMDSSQRPSRACLVTQMPPAAERAAIRSPFLDMAKPV